MALDITGKLLQVMPVQGGTSTRGNWSKQEFIIETQEQYPKKVCISLWGDKLKDLEGMQPGEALTVSVNIESREFNGRWYTDVRAWRIQRGDATASASTANIPPPIVDDSFVDGSDESIDDLPF
ncbi:MAG: DUF3127 domain-containing protein [Prevotellaceae bacterium]|jgi:hypothetical protein|nr:DUF3127 domain-containing protein [Prevotellaceae bacterium]